MKKTNALAIKLFLIVGLMFCFTFALIPLYNVFCKITGLNGKVDLKGPDSSARYKDMKQTTVALTAHPVVVEFDVNRHQGVACEISPEHPVLQVVPGELTATSYFVKNLSDKTLVIQAIPSISPGKVAQYLKKLECFCFERQILEPFAAQKMPLRFWLEPEFPSDVHRLTLSYTVFDVTHL